MSRFGERLRQAREDAGLSRTALAAVAGTDYGTVWRWRGAQLACQSHASSTSLHR